ncbi:DUF3022 domain-containing protein [Paraburkholderia denitrificans]|uniref:DUF3022 domain-containing protein n=1 Tax=Paraburkholderia denitrificans TaxID=694025 RepID=A0ABW0JBP4_9BURK
MKSFNFEQRVEEIQLSLAHLFESLKSPAVSVIDEGDRVFLHLTWVVESSRDSTLDARCAATIEATRAQLERYARLDTAQRRAIQQRIGALVRKRFDASRNRPQESGECAIEIALGDAIFETGSNGNYFPTLD